MQKWYILMRHKPEKYWYFIDILWAIFQRIVKNLFAIFRDNFKLIIDHNIQPERLKKYE